jgi:hemoglobin
MALPLFERLGGFARVRLIIAAFYDQVLETESLGAYFARADTRRLIDHQTKFMAQLMGGPVAFGDDVLRRAHAGLGVTREDFRLMAEILRDTLDDHGLQPSDVDQVLREFTRREALIVAREG